MALHRLVAFAVFTLVASAAPALAADTYYGDKNHTEVRFCWSHFGVSRQCAHFRDFDVVLQYDSAAPEHSELTATFKTDSIETLVPVFNEHMKAANLFDSQKFPEATFKTTKIEKTGEKTGKVMGDLTIKGVTKPITLDVTLNFAGMHPFPKNGMTLGFAATGALKRSDYNVAYAVPAVSDDITLEIQTEMNLKK